MDLLRLSWGDWGAGSRTAQLSSETTCSTMSSTRFLPGASSVLLLAAFHVHTRTVMYIHVHTRTYIHMDTRAYTAVLEPSAWRAASHMALLPASGRWSHSLPTFELMRRLRRRTREGRRYGRMGGRRERARGEYRFSSLVKQKQKGGKLRSLLIRRKKIFFVYL